MDIGTRPISDRHSQLTLAEQNQHLYNQYHQPENNPLENNQLQSVRATESQVRYFYQQANDGSHQQTGTHLDGSTRTQLLEQSSSIAAGSVSDRSDRLIAESYEPKSWFSRKNRQLINEYPNPVIDQPLSYTETTHANHSPAADISQLQPPPNSFASSLPPPQPVPPIPQYHLQQVTGCASETPNEFYSSSSHHDYNYTLYQRNAWHLSSGDPQFATQQYYNYNYYEGQHPQPNQHQQQQQQQQQQQLYNQQQYNINSFIRHQHEDKHDYNYYNDRQNQSIHLVPDEQFPYEKPANVPYTERYSNSCPNQASATHELANGPDHRHHIDEKNIRSPDEQNQAGRIDELKPATSAWSCEGQTNNFSSSHTPTTLSCTTNHPQENSWISTDNQQQLKQQQHNKSQEVQKKVDAGKTNLNNKVGSTGVSIQRTNQCSVCGRNYARPSTLKTHLRTHTNERPFKCNVCFKTFSQAANLTAHQRVHTGERPFSCPICGRQFSQSSSVITHSRTHSGERPYRCSMCSRTFSDSSTLTKHCRIHSGEKPYQCDYCPLNFSQSGNLSRHLKLHLMNGGNNNSIGNNRNGRSGAGSGGYGGASSTASSITSITSSSNQSTQNPSITE